ncbi:E3 ubiquitin-protein like [Actinidia chinensis var. chinensis]|uniref:E3 ubiquitin-protein like n=1 Tax=Actinidia chinensis var. chinensis TaxID=1590841 RepID=A0A2R6P2U4_ACTCC|nr:E3 ubiquitin-protein like [Actinidia chinensis var. chinensis]
MQSHPRWQANLESTLRLSLPSEWPRCRKRMLQGVYLRSTILFTTKTDLTRLIPPRGQRKQERLMLVVGRFLSRSPLIILDQFWQRMTQIENRVCWLVRLGRIEWSVGNGELTSLMLQGLLGSQIIGAQSVALSGGYEDDEDHGEWFLYTGSGGRDLSGNKRTNKTQSFDQKFDKMNEALRVSCRKGYPVRVVRSHKEKRSSYAPETGVRYDGIYRIEKCWRKVGIQGFKVCRYLFVRCDNAPAPWTSDDHGDHPRPLPTIPELKNATDITERKGVACWDYDEEKVSWLWKKSPPESRKQVDSGHVDGKSTTKVRRHKPILSIQEKLLKEFSCIICRKVMTLPLTTPCAHNFCKACLESAFSGQTFIKERTREGGRTLRAQKNVMKCPSCSNDISDFLQNLQVNRELMGVIESLQRQSKEAEDNESSEETDGTDEKSDVVPGDTELSNINSDIVIEEKEGIQNSPSKTQPEETHKLKKESGGDCIENPLEKTDAVSDHKICAAAKQELPAKEVKETAIGNESKRTNKRKADDGICSSPVAGVKTRSRKAN